MNDADKTLTLYRNLLNREFFEQQKEYRAWITILPKIKTEWDVVKSLVGAAGAPFNIG